MLRDTIPPFKYLLWYTVGAIVSVASLVWIVALADSGHPSVVPWFTLISGAAIFLAAWEEHADAEAVAHEEDLASIESEYRVLMAELAEQTDSKAA